MQIRAIVLTASLLALPCVALATEHPCTEDAKKQSMQLLKFHTDNDKRAEISDYVTQLTSIQNPANKEQQFDVLELTGYVYKATFRIRMIYAQVQSPCALVGQEILSLVSL